MVIIGNPPTKQKRRIKMFGKNNKIQNLISGLLSDTKFLRQGIEENEKKHNKQIETLTRKVYEKEIKLVKDNVDKFERELRMMLISKRFVGYKYKNYLVSFNGVSIDNNQILSGDIAKELFDYIEEYQKYKNDK